MSFTPKVGDKFRLLDKEWKVESVSGLSFQAIPDDGTILNIKQCLSWPNDEADKLDWIKPVPKCSREFAEAVKEKFMEAWGGGEGDNCESFHKWIKEHTED